MVKGLTGRDDVTRCTSLRGIGLDSLGATALLSILRTSVDKAKDLTMQDLAKFQTVGDLVDFLDDRDSFRGSSHEERKDDETSCGV